MAKRLSACPIEAFPLVNRFATSNHLRKRYKKIQQTLSNNKFYVKHEVEPIPHG